MVFVSYPQSKAARRPLKELKGFARVSLGAGEEKQVMIPVRLTDLDYFDMRHANQWVVEDGPVKIMVGGSSVEFPKTATGRHGLQEGFQQLLSRRAKAPMNVSQ